MMKQVGVCILFSTIISSLCFVYYITHLNGKRVQHDLHILPHFNKNKFPNYKNSSYQMIVPDIVHFLRLNQSEITFIEAACILSVIKNQMPTSVYIHTNDVDLTGKYWNYLLNDENFSNKYKIVPISIINTVFGQKLSTDGILYHGSDILRLRILRQYGGIFLDNDSYIVKNMDGFRKMEMSIGWDPGNQNIGTQILVAHPDARFIQLWLESYRDHYIPELWYYNAGDRPYQTILVHKPGLVYNASIEEFGVETLSNVLYNSYNPNWKNYFAIHLLQRHRDYLDHTYFKKFPVINEINVCRLNNTIGEMLRVAYYGSNKCPVKIIKAIRKKIKKRMMLRRRSLNNKKRRLHRLMLLKMSRNNKQRKLNVDNKAHAYRGENSIKQNKNIIVSHHNPDSTLNKNNVALNDSKKNNTDNSKENSKGILEIHTRNETTNSEIVKHNSTSASVKDKSVPGPDKLLATEIVGDEVNYYGNNIENSHKSKSKNDIKSKNNNAGNNVESKSNQISSKSHSSNNNNSEFNSKEEDLKNNSGSDVNSKEDNKENETSEIKESTSAEESSEIHVGPATKPLTLKQNKN